MVLVLNKIDLVPKQVVADWLTVLRRSHPTIAIKASQERGSAEEVQVDAGSTSVPVGMDGLLHLLKNYARTGGVGGKSKPTIVVGILGYPVRQITNLPDCYSFARFSHSHYFFTSHRTSARAVLLMH